MVPRIAVRTPRHSGQSATCNERLTARKLLCALDDRLTRLRRQHEQAGSASGAEVPLERVARRRSGRTLVPSRLLYLSSECLGSLVDQVLALSLELLDQLLLESRQGVPDRLFQRTDAFLGHAPSPLPLGEGMHFLPSIVPTAQLDPEATGTVDARDLTCRMRAARGIARADTGSLGLPPSPPNSDPSSPYSVRPT